MKPVHSVAVMVAVLACGAARGQDGGPVHEGAVIARSELRKKLPKLNIDVAKWIRDPLVIEIKPDGETIQEALKRAKPGTVINVRAGVYPGRVDFSGIHGTLERPILLISADGPGRARLVGEKKAKAATVSGWGTSNIGVYGFEIFCDTAGGDHGGVKFGGAWAKPAENIVVAGNLITGAGQDGCKFLHGARNFAVVGNVIAGNWRQECFDNVSVEQAIYAYNTTADSESYWTSLTLKGGAREIEVFGNLLAAKTRVQLSIGGFGTYAPQVPEYWESKFQASRINVHGNDIGEPQSIAFAGGQDSLVRRNLLRAKVSESEGGARGIKTVPSSGNVVADNTTAPGPVGAGALPANFNLKPGGASPKKAKS